MLQSTSIVDEARQTIYMRMQQKGYSKARILSELKISEQHFDNQMRHNKDMKYSFVESIDRILTHKQKTVIELMELTESLLKEFVGFREDYMNALKDRTVDTNELQNLEAKSNLIKSNLDKLLDEVGAVENQTLEV